MEDPMYDAIRSLIVIEGFFCLYLLLMCKFRYWRHLGNAAWRTSRFPWSMLLVGLSGIVGIVFPIVAMIGRLGTNRPLSYPSIFGFIIFTLAIGGLVIWYNELREQIGRIN